MSAGPQHIGVRRGSADRKRAVLDVILASPHPVTRRDIHERLRRSCTLKQIEGITRALLADGVIEYERHARGGHEPSTLRAVAAERRVG